jgi:hypothetical protein
MARAVYQGVDYETVSYNPTADRWYLRPLKGPDAVLVDSQVHDLEIECERCGEFKAYWYPVTEQALWLCSNCQEAVAHGE